MHTSDIVCHAEACKVSSQLGSIGHTLLLTGASLVHDMASLKHMLVPEIGTQSPQAASVFLQRAESVSDERRSRVHSFSLSSGKPYRVLLVAAHKFEAPSHRSSWRSRRSCLLPPGGAGSSAVISSHASSRTLEKRSAEFSTPLPAAAQQQCRASASFPADVSYELMTAHVQSQFSRARVAVSQSNS